MPESVEQRLRCAGSPAVVRPSSTTSTSCVPGAPHATAACPAEAVPDEYWSPPPGIQGPVQLAVTPVEVTGGAGDEASSAVTTARSGLAGSIASAGLCCTLPPPTAVCSAESHGG